MTTDYAKQLTQPPADSTAGSIISIPSRSNPFVEYRVDAAAGRCSCPARPGKCWHLKIARVSLQSGVPVRELLYRLKKAKDLGGCGAETCRYCLGLVTRYPCPASDEGRAAWSRMVINEQIERTI